jgi:ubiquinone/menaquinone biosynthesis C-methylase UbiE
VSRSRPSHFDALADCYDRFRIGYSDDLYDAIFDYGLRPGASVLDVGTGTGLVAAALVARGCSVTGLDASEAMLGRARERVPGARFVSGSATDLPFASASFDAATSAQAFHWFDQARALAELERVVRPGGILAVWWKGLMRGDALNLLRQQVAADLGLAPTKDLMAGGFDAFDESALIDRRLRVLPWLVEMRVEDALGYERSRARARDAYGDRIEAYFARLAERLGPPNAEMTLSYLQMLYLGRVAERA